MSAARDWSLRDRLLLLVVAASTLAWLASAVAVFRAARDEGARLYDAHLEDVARLLLQFGGKETAGATDALRGRSGDMLDERFRYQIWSAGGVLLRASQSARREPFIPLTQPGHQLRSTDGTDYRVFASWSDDRTRQVQVAERDDVRGFALGRAAPSLVLLFVACTAGLVLLIVRLYGRTTRAVEQATAQLNERANGDTRPLDIDAAPAELRPMFDAINALCRRVANALESERRFTAAAAHELRTPLAAVRVQAQVAARARTQADARDALAILNVCVERASRTIDQLLTLAQIEGTQVQAGSAATVELASLAARVIQDMNPLLRARGIDLTMNLEPVAVVGLEQGLAALLRNLLDNAARHSLPNSQVRVECGTAKDDAFLAVDDSGPGIPPEERERVFEPFYRLPSHGADGAGVGLSIVQSVAHVHGGRVVLSDSDLGGLRAAFFLTRRLAHESAGDQAATTARDAGPSKKKGRSGQVGNHPPTPRG